MSQDQPVDADASAAPASAHGEQPAGMRRITQADLLIAAVGLVALAVLALVVMS